MLLTRIFIIIRGVRCPLTVAQRGLHANLLKCEDSDEN